MIESVPWWMWILGFLLVLGPLVTVHELGHYLVARWCGMRVHAFAIFMGGVLKTDLKPYLPSIDAIPDATRAVSG